MALTLLCAGCSPSERDEAEASVKAALKDRFHHHAWSVSLVRVGANWSVTLDGPGFRALSFVAAAQQLEKSIAERVDPPAAAAGPASAAPSAGVPPAQAPAGVVRDRQECHKCRRAYVVTYELEEDESQETVSVACPYCWQMNPVLVGESAARTESFRAERLEA